jgi:hypothetical protein
VRSCTLKGALREAMLRGAGVQGGVEQRQSDDGGRRARHASSAREDAAWFHLCDGQFIVWVVVSGAWTAPWWSWLLMPPVC